MAEIELKGEKEEEPDLGLRRELHGVKGEGRWFWHYECEHVTEDSYPIEACVPLGSHINLVLCKHCWETLRGQVAKEFIQEQLKRVSPPELLESLFSRITEE